MSTTTTTETMSDTAGNLWGDLIVILGVAVILMGGLAQGALIAAGGVALMPRSRVIGLGSKVIGYALVGTGLVVSAI